MTTHPRRPNPPQRPTGALLRTLAALFSAAATASAGAQTATPPPPSSSSPSSASTTQEEIVELSPFTVNTSKDVGYVAENTLAGSRLNSRLRDTASSVSVFTKEFLDDTGITNLRELVEYSVNSEMDTNSQGGSGEQNRIIGGHALTQGIQIRGLIASFGMDYFTSITPTDPYRVGRYEDSRGPNSILFGIGAPGGLLNESSKIASLNKDSAMVRYSFGSWDRSRVEVDGSKVVIPQKLAVSVAALDQENGGWRDFEFHDKERLFGSVVYRPIPSLTFTAMGEIGRDIDSIVRSFTESDQALAWYDNREAFGAGAVTFTPNNALPTAAQQALGITGRDGARAGMNRRAVYIENDGTVYDAIGTYLTGSYNNAAVRHPDGSPGFTTPFLRLYEPSFYPLERNAVGPGMTRNQSLNNYTLTLDWQATRDLIFNLGHNYQETNAVLHLMNGQNPALRGEANRTLGIGGPANPYAGQLYFDGNWTRDAHFARSRETRLSASYNFDPKSKWFGQHRLAASLSRTEVLDYRANSWLVLAGRPFNATPSNPNNRLIVRNYVTDGDPGTYRVGDWRSLPPTVTFGGQTYDTVFANVESGGADNGGTDQEMDSRLAALQSTFLQGKVVTTFGYRKDIVDSTQLGYIDDPVRGAVVDLNPANGILNPLTGQTRTAGIVYHAFDWLSLIANKSSNVGIPPLARTVYPEGKLAPLSKGEGEDYGLGFDLLEGRVNARVVYFRGSEIGRVTAPLAANLRDRNVRVMDALATALVGPGLPFTQEQWNELRAPLTPPVSSVSSDFDSEGYEARITANLTSNWRFVANYSYTDSGRSNYAQEAIDFHGLRQADAILLQQGVSQNAAGQFVVDPGAYLPGGAVAKWIELGALNPAANLSTLGTSSNITAAEEIFNLVEVINDDKEQQQKRWGVRPHKISLFTAYDFRRGWMNGITLGGGYRWRSANVIGSNSRGEEITGRPIVAADLLLAYTRKIGQLPGRFRFQLNISNLFDRSDIIPSRLATSESAPDGFFIPGGRGVAYTRFDLVTPREFRFTTTYSF